METEREVVTNPEETLVEDKTDAKKTATGNNAEDHMELGKIFEKFVEEQRAVPLDVQKNVAALQTLLNELQSL